MILSRMASSCLNTSHIEPMNPFQTNSMIFIKTYLVLGSGPGPGPGLIRILDLVQDLVVDQVLDQVQAGGHAGRGGEGRAGEAGGLKRYSMLFCWPVQPLARK